MAEAPSQLSAAALRIAGHVGQAALDRIADRGLAAAAELDQHLAAVRAELAVCQALPMPRAPRGHGTTRRGDTLLTSLSRWILAGRTGRRAVGSDADLHTRLAMLRRTTLTCPDVPFASDALQAEPVVPVTMLLHYASGFVGAGIRSGWQPAQSADATDWASLRLAAICKLVGQAEAAADVHPDLSASA